MVGVLAVVRKSSLTLKKVGDYRKALTALCCSENVSK